MMLIVYASAIVMSNSMLRRRRTHELNQAQIDDLIKYLKSKTKTTSPLKMTTKSFLGKIKNALKNSDKRAALFLTFNARRPDSGRKEGEFKQLIEDSIILAEALHVDPECIFDRSNSTSFVLPDNFDFFFFTMLDKGRICKRNQHHALYLENRVKGNYFDYFVL